MFTDGDGSSQTSDSLPSLSESRRTTSGFSANWAGGDITGGLDRTSSDESNFASMYGHRIFLANTKKVFSDQSFKDSISFFCSSTISFRSKFCRPSDLHLSE